MPEPLISVRAVDFDNAQDVEHYLGLLDAYAQDPMGAGEPLRTEVRERLASDLAQHPTAHCLIAQQGDDAIGFATCFLGYSTFQARPLLNIHDIAVLPAWRGSSAADRLMAAIAELGRQLDCCRLTLEVRADNPRAQRLYKRSGFAPAQCGLFMEKSL